ncbi:MAG: type II toxin-antitoxin system RelE/ParE family toxin [Acidobacteriota bacterium]
MKYDLRFKPRSLKDLKKLPRTTQRQIVDRVESMSEGLSGDVKRLTQFTPEYRLRVGSYRVLFEVEGTSIVIYRIRHRKEAYRP